jgi:hypothetical protein
VQAYRDGKIWAADVVRTSGKPKQLGVEADRESMTADGRDLIFLSIYVADEQGVIVPTPDNFWWHSKSVGPGKLSVSAMANQLPTNHAKQRRGLL